MAQEQKRGNRESKKPKAKKTESGKPLAGYLAKGAEMSAERVSRIPKARGKGDK
jgi:hypothetical protein